MRPRTLTALLAAAVLGVALGIGGGLALDRGRGPADNQHQPFADPLSLDVPLVNQPCTGHYVLAIGKGDGVSGLAPGLAANPQGHYLDTQKSCEVQWRVDGKPTPRWVAYLGPYRSGLQACQVRMTAEHRGTSVSRLQHGSAGPIHCLCYLDYNSMPMLRIGMTASATDIMWVYALQNLLIEMGRAPDTSATGVFDLATAAAVRAFQQQRHLPVTGVVDADTWRAFQDRCELYDLPSANASP